MVGMRGFDDSVTSLASWFAIEDSGLLVKSVGVCHELLEASIRHKQHQLLMKQTMESFALTQCGFHATEDNLHDL
jgi:hypothetical protein